MASMPRKRGRPTVYMKDENGKPIKPPGSVNCRYTKRKTGGRQPKKEKARAASVAKVEADNNPTGVKQTPSSSHTASSPAGSPAATKAAEVDAYNNPTGDEHTPSPSHAASNPADETPAIVEWYDETWISEEVKERAAANVQRMQEEAWGYRSVSQWREPKWTDLRENFDFQCDL